MMKLPALRHLTTGLILGCAMTSSATFAVAEVSSVHPAAAPVESSAAKHQEIVAKPEQSSATKHPQTIATPGRQAGETNFEAGKALIHLNVESYTLANGLKVLLYEDHSSPFACAAR